MQANPSLLVCPTLNGDAQQEFIEKVTSNSNQDSSELNKSENYSSQRQGRRHDKGNNINDDFTFACHEMKHTISAEDIFHNGQIRPTFPFSEQGKINAQENVNLVGNIPVERVFVERSDLPSSSSSDVDRIAEGPYCAWSMESAATDSTERCTKSNSTGFSKLRRFCDLLFRSNSDGKDTLVLLNNDNNNNNNNNNKKKNETTTASSPEKKSSGARGRGNGGGGGVVRGSRKVKGVTNEMASENGATSYAVHYGSNRGAKEGERIKSYLPYRPNLLGIFTNASVMSRNINPNY